MNKKYEFETLEQYREYLRENSRKWYANPENAEKKKAYQREYYKKKKLKEAEENLKDNK